MIFMYVSWCVENPKHEILNKSGYPNDQMLELYCFGPLDFGM